MIEIRWHGRGGQGAKTASLLLADIAFNTGKYIQGFPEYGPERMGAPITAYNRISDKPIRNHSNIYEPDYVVVVDDTLLSTVDVTNGLKENGALIINTNLGESEIDLTKDLYFTINDEDVSNVIQFSFIDVDTISIKFIKVGNYELKLHLHGVNYKDKSINLSIN